MTEWPPVASPQAFEELCAAVARRQLAPVDSQVYGRSGQTQYGVDVIDCADRGIAIQAKLKSGAHGARLTKQDVIDEVAKAKAFTPPLTRYIVATTSPSDRHLIDLARSLTRDHEAQGLFTVAIWFWPHFCGWFDKDPELVRQFHGGLVRAATPAALQELGSFAGGSILGENALSGEVQRAIGRARQMLDDGRHGDSISAFTAILSDNDPRLSSSDRFRVLTNIAAGHLGLDQPSDAAEYFLRAVDHATEDQDEKARGNRAFAYVLMNEPQKARDVLAEASEHYPDSAYLASMFVRAMDSPDALCEYAATLPGPAEVDDTLHGAIAWKAYQFRLHTLAQEWLQATAEQDGQHSAEAHGMLGTILLEEGLHGRADSETPRGVCIEEAIQHYSSAWATLTHDDGRQLHAGWLVNRGIAYHAIGALAEAEADYKDACALASGADADILSMHMAALRLETGQVAEAMTSLRSAPGDLLAAHVMEADALIKKANWLTRNNASTSSMSAR